MNIFISRNQDLLKTILLHHRPQVHRVSRNRCRMWQKIKLSYFLQQLFEQLTTSTTFEKIELLLNEFVNLSSRSQFCFCTTSIPPTSNSPFLHLGLAFPWCRVWPQKIVLKSKIATLLFP